MNTLATVFAILTGILLRLIVPLTLTALVVYVLHKLDARWQAEAELEKKLLVKNEMPCLKEQGLSVERMKAHLALGERPCWQTHRLANGHLREDCLDCEVFHDAPVPVPHRHGHAHI
ncbi:MAG: hypothetical protein C4586_05490 [Anaerolineaceae bacterium]|nr:MAG: hypothetical protein C4586_05490 [Anaerolineaceae bacterium]